MLNRLVTAVIGVVAVAPVACASLALAAAEAGSAFLPGTLVSANHLAVACATEDAEEKFTPQGFPDSAASLARMTQANCKAIAPDTRLVVLSLMESGVMLVRPASGFSDAFMVLARDFSVVRLPA